MEKKQRVIYLDIIRIVACFLVVLVHVTAQHISEFETNSSEFVIHGSFSCIAYAGVALYIMISGALMLSAKKEITVKSILKRVVHFYFLYFFWKWIYCFFDAYDKGIRIDKSFIRDAAIETLSGRGYYHLWFLPTIALIYLFIPLIKGSLADKNSKNICILYLSVFFFINILLETAFNFDFKFKYMIIDFLHYNDFYLFTGYLGYFVLGHFINQYGNEIKKGIRIVIYIAAVIAAVLPGFVDSYISIRDGKTVYPLSTPFSLFTFIITFAIFLFIKSVNENKNVNEKLAVVISKVSLLTLGVYLIHPIILWEFEKIGISGIMFMPLFAIIIVTILVTLVTALPVALIMYIPFVNKIIK